MYDFFIKLLALFIPSKTKRKSFREKHLKLASVRAVSSGSLSIQDELKKSIKLVRKDMRILSQQMQMLHWYGNGGESIVQRKKDFYLNLPQATGNLRILQNVLLQMLIDIDKVCRDNGIRYWIQAGTLMGAVRHKGWIPWDDDLDIGMPEDDLSKLRKALVDNEKYRIDDYYHFKKRYLGRFTRIRLKEPGINVFLDIAVYQFCTRTSLDDAWNGITQTREEFEKKTLSLVKKLKRVYYNEIIDDLRDLKYVEDFFREEINKVHQSDGSYIYWASYSVPARWKRIFDKSMFFPLAELDFEGRKLYAPRQYEEYLALQYGDIYMLPWGFEPAHVAAFGLYNNLHLIGNANHLKNE